MKKKIIIAVIILLILFVPIPCGTYKDGGTKAYQALTYKIVKWNRFFYNDFKFQETVVYWFPHNFKDIDTLWKGMCIDPAFENISEYESFEAAEKNQ